MQFEKESLLLYMLTDGNSYLPLNKNATAFSALGESVDWSCQEESSRTIWIIVQLALQANNGSVYAPILDERDIPSNTSKSKANIAGAITPCSWLDDVFSINVLFQSALYEIKIKVGERSTLQLVSEQLLLDGLDVSGPQLTEVQPNAESVDEKQEETSEDSTSLSEAIPGSTIPGDWTDFDVKELVVSVRESLKQLASYPSISIARVEALDLGSNIILLRALGGISNDSVMSPIELLGLQYEARNELPAGGLVLTPGMALLPILRDLRPSIRSPAEAEAWAALALQLRGTPALLNYEGPLATGPNPPIVPYSDDYWREWRISSNPEGYTAVSYTHLTLPTKA